MSHCCYDRRFHPGDAFEDGEVLQRLESGSAAPDDTNAVMTGSVRVG